MILINQFIITLFQYLLVWRSSIESFESCIVSNHFYALLLFILVNLSCFCFVQTYGKWYYLDIYFFLRTVNANRKKSTDFKHSFSTYWCIITVNCKEISLSNFFFSFFSLALPWTSIFSLKLPFLYALFDEFKVWYLPKTSHHLQFYL